MTVSEKVARLKGRKKALFFDLDGTLTDDNDIIPDDIYKKLLDIKISGTPIFLNTGRSKAYLPDNIANDKLFDGFLCGGAYIEIHGNIIMNIQMPKEARRELIEFSEKNSTLLIFEGVEENYSINCKLSGNFVEIPGKMSIEEFISGKDATPTKATLFRLPLEMDCSGIKYSHMIRFEKYAEAMTNGCGKDVVMLKAAEYTGVEKDCTIAFGDSENDNAMLRAAGIAVAMEHSPQGTKQNADIVANIGKALEIIGI